MLHILNSSRKDIDDKMDILSYMGIIIDVGGGIKYTLETDRCIQKKKTASKGKTVSLFLSYKILPIILLYNVPIV